ncbi:Methyltransferase type 11 [Emticicia oligotrophica DSM 17448]|uniref:Methyltransferase type 11 n=1 Tax=Emticicia oligotrophica (strain DSM 17448 / CIP 109782 / MTCC 6937 / GPTSA100-15) TaxID=929562 RepID=A0ABN4ARM4_EMTOG|nr:class I SAM-dependent methyltransferase [Emticicia oligotrophica]AFK05004.1 Methyltransferase type 11 [Emticicia oligotrophica DSM 17448]
MSQLYTNLAKVYHEIYQKLFDYDQEFKFYDKHLKENDVRSVLEIGCGTGNLAKRLINAKFDYFGVDLFQEMLDIAATNAHKEYFLQADVRSMKLDKTFDCVIITGRSISYLTENKGIIEALKCINNSLKMNGLLLFDAIDAEKMFLDFKEIRTDKLEVEFGQNKYKRVSKSKKNLSSGWTWDWESIYYQMNDYGIYEKIGEDFSTLRAFIKDELTLFLRMCGFELISILPKKSYAWEDNFYIVRKVAYDF